MPFIAPIVAAVGTAVTAVGSFVAGLGAIGSAVVGIGLNVAVGYLQQSLNGKQQKQPSGVQFDRQYGTTVPRQVACGLVGISGHDCYVNTFGPSNYELQQVYCLSDYYSDGLSRVAINGEWVVLSPTETSIRGYEVLSGDFAGLIFIKFMDGTQTAALPMLTTYAYPAQRWTANHIGIGQTYIVVSMTYNQERNNSFPDFFFEFRGARLYDWRKDDTAGGSGPHRWGDYSTYEYSENPIVIEYNYRRGFAIGDDVFCGMGMPSSDLPLNKWVPPANICDELTDDGIRYRCSIMLDCTATHSENIESIELSCGALTIDAVDGSWPIVGHDQPIVATFTDYDLVSGEPVTYQNKRSMGDLINSVSGNFPSPAEVWSMIGYETQTNSTFVTLDRRDRDIAIDFPQVRFQYQAANLAAIYLMENRFEATATLTLRPRFQTLEPGDWVRWNSARRGNKVYVVTDVQVMSLDSDAPRNVVVSLQERDGSIYDGVTVPPIVLPYPPGLPVYMTEVQSFSVIPVTLQGNDGRLLPGIRAAWAAIDDVTVTYVDIQYYPTGQPSSIIYKSVPANQTVAIISEGLVKNTEYMVKTRIRTEPPRETVWSAGELVTTDDYPDADIDVYLANVKGDAYKTLELLRNDINEVVSRLDVIARDTAQGFGTVTKQNYASITQGRAQAVALTELSASVELIDDELVAQASIVNALNASVGEISGSGLWRMEVRAGAGDVVAKLAILMRATISSAWVEVGTIWEAGFTGGNPALPFSRMTNFADKFIVINPNNGAQLPVFVVDGALNQVIISNAMIKNLNATNINVNSLSSLSINAGEIRAGILRDENNTMIINLSTGLILIQST